MTLKQGCWVTSRASLSSHGMVEVVGSPDCPPPEKPAAVPFLPNRDLVQGCWVTSRASLSSHGMVEEVGSPDCLPPEKPAAVPLAVLEGHEDSSKFGTLKK